MLVTLTIACAVATLALIAAEIKGNDRIRALAKFMASGAFVMIGLEAFHVSEAARPFATCIFVGLVLGAIGDIALLGRSNAAFMAGLVAFLGGHIMYVVAAAQVLPIEAWPSAAGAFAVIPIAAAGIALFAWLWPHLGALRIPVIVYVIAIAMMVVAAIAVARGHALPEPQRCLFLIGAVLFFISDFAVARDKFIKRGNNRIWGLPSYFAGQLLIAWTLIGL